MLDKSIGGRQESSPRRRVCVNTASASSVDTSHQLNLQTCPVYDVNLAGIEDKFTSAIYNAGIQGVKCQERNNCALFKQWQNQSDFQFGFIPLDEQIMPDTSVVNCSDGLSPFNIHALVRATNKHNYMEARLPVKSQLNISEWKSRLTNYWDQQLLQLLEFGFPLDFNRNCPLRCEGTNHSSAIEHPSDVDAYIKEETEFNAILGPFQQNPIEGGHCSPFMTRHKPNSDRRHVIIDLSWPQGASVNSGINKNTYLESQFDLTFPSVDDITNEVKRLGRGALLYKVDVSRAFRHVKVDPGDYDLLGLEWGGTYVDTCLPFGTRHGSQIFQRISDAVRHLMRQAGFSIIDYIDDYIGVGVTTVAQRSFDHLLSLMEKLGLSVSKSKLVPPATRVVCLGVLIDTVAGTIAIPPEKLRQINDTVKEWLEKRSCTKRQLQSILGLLLYVHKCVKPARVFLNRMLDMLRSSQNAQKITVTSDFRRDVRWFAKFLPTYNGINFYDHRTIDHVLDLDACLTGLGGRFGNLVYFLPLQHGYKECTIVHLEMVNILLALRLFCSYWAGRKVLVRCDNKAVVSVLSSGRSRDPFLSACARNIWYCSAKHDIDVDYVHIRGRDNEVADLLSRWSGSRADWGRLLQHIPNPCWLQANEQMLAFHPDL